jgi:hypothetical protein
MKSSNMNHITVYLAIGLLVFLVSGKMFTEQFREGKSAPAPPKATKFPCSNYRSSESECIANPGCKFSVLKYGKCTRKDNDTSIQGNTCAAIPDTNYMESQCPKTCKFTAIGPYNECSS